MPLSINPLAQLITSSTEAISKAAGEASAAIGDSFNKANLDAKISQLSGDIGSGLNGMTASAKGAFGTLTDKAGGFGLNPGSALSGLGNITSSIPGVGAGINSLQSVVGSTSNIASDISGSLNKLAGGNLAGGLMGIAGSISSAAGMLNNILSLRRGANLPSGGELFMKQGQAIQLNPGAKNDWRVRINAEWNIFPGDMFSVLKNTGGVVWPYTPNLTISTKANYTPLEVVHNNYPFYGYKNSAVEDIQISGEFSAETETDAAYWIAATTFFRTATKMFFGEGALAGNPPIICHLYGYGSSVFDKVPVIIKAFSVDMKDDVNYVRCNAFGTNTWVPVVSTISVTVAPVYNRRRLRKFNLEDFAKGKPASGVGYI